MPAMPSEKSRKYTATLYSRKPGLKGPHFRNQPASALKKVKQSSKQLTNHDWLAVFTPTRIDDECDEEEDEPEMTRNLVIYGSTSTGTSVTRGSLCPYGKDACTGARWGHAGEIRNA